MGRSLIWIEDANGGWACSSCRWRFPVPTLLTGKEAKAAYDRLAAVKFREHKCEADISFPAATQEIRRAADPTFAERARKLIVQGYKPKDAVELVVQETALEHRNDPRIMEKARADAEDFLLKVRRGLI
jgi:uncharacterized protein YoaH (UPF0181 family)